MFDNRAEERAVRDNRDSGIRTVHGKIVCEDDELLDWECHMNRVSKGGKRNRYADEYEQEIAKVDKRARE